MQELVRIKAIHLFDNASGDWAEAFQFLHSEIDTIKKELALPCVTPVKELLLTAIQRAIEELSSENLFTDERHQEAHVRQIALINSCNFNELSELTGDALKQARVQGWNLLVDEVLRCGVEL